MVLNDFRMYGPEPAELSSSQFSAVSLVEALAASVPPWASTTFMFKMPQAGLGRMYGKRRVGRAGRHDDRLGPVGGDRLPGQQERRVALQVDHPGQRPDDVGRGHGVPSENLAVGLRWKTYFRPPFSVWYDVARCGTTFLKLPLRCR